MKSYMMIAAVLMVGICGSAFGSLTYSGAVEYSVGSGANTAYVAVDFDYGNAFVFEYRWDGAATGFDALMAIDADRALTVDSGSDPSWGVFVNGFAYPGGVKYNYSSASYNGWAYFISSNGESWSSAPVGVGDRSLSNGAWDSWVWSNYDENWSALRQPGQMAIPEPMTMAMLGLGMILAVRKK